MKHRSIRVGQQIKEIVSEIIQRDLREKVKFFSIPHVKVSDDSSFARIYISFFEVNSEKEFEKITKAKGFIRSQLAKKMQIKKVPELDFVLDNSLREGSDIVDKLETLVGE